MVEIAPWSAEQEEMARLANGRAAIINCNVDLGVGIEEIEGGRARFFVDPKPPGADNQASVALRLMMEETAVKWLKIVAPHRLSFGANDT